MVVLAALPLWGGPDLMRTLVELFVLLALAQMWNLLAGYPGLVSVGQQAYIGIGAYILLVLTDLGLSVWLVLPAVVFGCTLVALVVAPLIFSLEVGHFAIGTWVVAEVFRLWIINIPQVGGGSGATITGLARIPITTRQRLVYWLALAVGAGAVVSVYLLLRSRLGLALMAPVRDNTIAAESVGVDVFRNRLRVHLIGAVG